MTITTLSSRAFNQEISKAKKLSKNGPVYIADRGKPAYVLLSWEAFKNSAVRVEISLLPCKCQKPLM